MNEDTSVNQYSPINSDNQTEAMNANLVDENEIKEHENQPEFNEKNLMEENNEQISGDEHADNLDKNLEDNSNRNQDVNLEENLENNPINNDNKINELANLNDDISDDENFKDDELDFEEGDNSRGNLGDEKKQVKAVAEEDGEVNSEEELEDGEVKEEDSDEEAGEQQEDDLNKPAPANLNSLCRFYSKGLCTWGANCRFIHQKPIGTSSVYNPKINQINQPKSNLSNKPIEILNKNPIYSKHNNPPPPAQNYTKLMSNTYYNQNDNQYERNMKYVKKDTTYSKSYRTAPVDDLDYDQPMPPLNKNKYHQQSMDERSPISNYPRNTSSSYYTSSSKHHLSHQSPNQVPSSNYRSSSTRSAHNSQPPPPPTHSDETEYERKRRLAFESAPWNESMDLSPSLQHSTRSSPLDRHSQSSGSKLYSSNKYSSKQIDNTAEQYYDPWRRSKSPYNNSSSRQNTGQIYHHSRSKSKSDSGSNEFSDPEPVEPQYSHKKRLDPEFPNKHRPSGYRDNNGSGENSSSYHHHHHSSSTYDRSLDRLDHPSSSTSQNKKSYYKEPIDELPQTPSSSYQKGNTTPIPDEIDIPNYERPKNITRTRKDSWSDSDTEGSCSSNSSYSESGSESENTDNDEPYSRTNKFESTREVGSKLKGDDVFNSSNEPQNKRQRTISDHSRLSSKHEFNKSRSPYSPSNESPSYRYSSGRKKQSVNMNCEIGSPFFNEDALESNRSNERSSKHLENRNGSGGNDDNKKTELLEQLKSIEEAIARKRSKLK